MNRRIARQRPEPTAALVPILNREFRTCGGAAQRWDCRPKRRRRCSTRQSTGTTTSESDPTSFPATRIDTKVPRLPCVKALSNSAYVVYLRVSTREQGDSRLGIEAQRETVSSFAALRGPAIAAVFEEIRSARGDDAYTRPQLESAIATARRLRVPLLVARLDRLSRSVALTSRLMASDVPFVAADMPNASRVTLQLAAVMAEYESRLTGERTRAAMAAARELGASFGARSWCFSPDTRLRAAEGARASHVARAREAYADFATEAVVLRDAGRSWTAIAAFLNARGYTVLGGGAWTIHSVQRLVRREVDTASTERRMVLEDFAAVAGSMLPSTRLPEALGRRVFDVHAVRGGREESFVASGRPRSAVAYLRVSSRTQGVDGLGIAAQRESVRRFCGESGLTTLAEYSEVERAWRSPLEKRPRLVEALAHARATDATVVIARLDRLARNASLVHHLIEAGARFICADAPWADDTTIGMLAVLAEREARLISDRMRDVRAEAKESDRPWRHVSNLRPEHQPEAVRKSAELRRRRTRERYAYVEPIAAALRADGLSLRAVARELKQRGFVTQRGSAWTDVSTSALLRRLEQPSPPRFLGSGAVSSASEPGMSEVEVAGH